MAANPDADQLREEAASFRRLAKERYPSTGGIILTVAHYFEAHARQIDRLKARGW